MSEVVQKVTTSVFTSKISIFFKIAQNVTKYLGNFWNKICHQELSLIFNNPSIGIFKGNNYLQLCKLFITICFKVFDVKINTILSYLQQQRNIERLNLALGLVTSCHGWRLLAEVCSMSIGDPNKSQKVGVGLKQNFSRE